MNPDIEKLRIVNYPNPVLRRKAKPIEAVTPVVQAVAQRMLQLMHEAPGVGLAAPQVGLDWRLFVACTTGEPEDDTVFINPRLVNPTRELADVDEGCLSLPDITVRVRRPEGITIEALDIEGRPFTLTGTELAARVWQHEYDHLDGVLIIDKMPMSDRLANQRKIRDLEAIYRP